jgi:phosphoribosylamine---glycine ligase
MRLQSDLVSLCGAAVRGCLDGAEMRWDARAALGVVMAAGGYPDHYRTGDPIRGLEAADALPGKVFHAGTRAGGPQVLTAGGRVLCAVGLGEHIADARREAYDLVHAIHWEGAQYRRDIGERALAQPPP